MKQSPNVQELIGKVSQPSDMQVFHSRNRYLDTPTVAPSQYFRMIVPRVNANALLDCRNIRMRYQLTITSTDGSIAVDSNFAYPFSRVRISSGSTVLLDINEAALLMAVEYNSKQTVAVSAYQQSLVGDGNLAARQGWAAATTEYLIPLWPDNTFLRRDGLFDVNASSDCILEFWTLSPAQFLYSPGNDTAAVFAMTEIQILSQYIISQSLTQYFRSNPMSFTCLDYSYRYDSTNLQNTQTKLDSSYTSLNGFFMVLRAAAVESAINTQNKMTVWNANSIQSFQLLLNQQNFFDQPIDSFAQQFQELLHMRPEADEASFFTGAFSSTRYLIGIRLSAAPELFRRSITSGVKTAALNNAIYVQLNFGSAPSLQRIDSFLQSDVIIFSAPNTRDLQVKY